MLKECIKSILYKIKLSKCWPRNSAQTVVGAVKHVKKAVLVFKLCVGLGHCYGWVDRDAIIYQTEQCLGRVEVQQSSLNDAAHLAVRYLLEEQVLLALQHRQITSSFASLHNHWNSIWSVI